MIDEVRKQSKLDNTLVIDIEGDDACAEGSAIGAAFDMAAIRGINMPVADQLKYYAAWGDATTQPHMSAT